MLKALINKYLLSPRLWLVGALFALAGSFVVDYIEAQKSADRALALRQGSPNPVLIQEFDATRNQGPAREVLIWAEQGPFAPVSVSLGPEGEEVMAVIAPLFGVSDKGIASIRTRVERAEGAVIRPVPRPSKPETLPEGLGYVIHWQEKGEVSLDEVDLYSDYFGRGEIGPVVSVNGASIAPGDMTLIVKGAMAAKGLALADNYLAVSPYVNGRLEALAPPPSSGLHIALMTTGAVMAVVAIGLSLRFIYAQQARPPKPRKPGHQDTRQSPGTTDKARSRFETLPTQDEVYAAAQAERNRQREQQRAPRPSWLSSALNGVGRLKIRQ